MGKVLTLGGQIDQLFKVDDQLKELNAKVKILKQEKDQLEQTLIAALGEQKLEQSRGSQGSATISRAIVPHAEDWDLIYKFIHSKKMAYLLERRIGAQKYRDTIATIRGGKIPGIKSFERVTLSLRRNN